MLISLHISLTIVQLEGNLLIFHKNKAKIIHNVHKLMYAQSIYDDCTAMLFLSSIVVTNVYLLNQHVRLKKSLLISIVYLFTSAIQH